MGVKTPCSKADFFSDFSLKMSRETAQKRKERNYQELKIKLKTILENKKYIIRENLATKGFARFDSFDALSQADFTEIVSSWLIENGMDLKKVDISSDRAIIMESEKTGCIIS